MSRRTWYVALGLLVLALIASVVQVVVGEATLWSWISMVFLLLALASLLARPPLR